MRQFIRNLSLQKKIQTIAFICIFIMTVAALVSLRLITTSYDRILYRTTASSLSASSMGMHNCLETLNTMADLFLADPIIQTGLSTLKDSVQVQDTSNAYRDVYATLTEYYFTFRKNHINYMGLYQNNFSIHTYLPFSRTPLPTEVEEYLLQKARDGSGGTVWATDYAEEYGLFLVKSIRRTEYLQLDELGILIVNVDLDGLVTEAAGSGFLQTESAYLLFDKENLIYSSAPFFGDMPADYAKQFPGHYGLTVYSGSDFTARPSDSQSVGTSHRKMEVFYVKSHIPGVGWDYICMIPYDSIMSSLHTGQVLCFILLLASVIVSFLLSSGLIHSITRHFDTLLQKIRNFGDGKQEPLSIHYDYQNRSDELGILHVQFDHMVDEVNQLIKTNYLNEILIKEAQFKALENQMNPHFLYNTLESINWRAKIMGAKDISSMAESLGALLRFTLDQTNKEVSLRRELESVQCYMTIQKYRYEERLDYQILVPENLMSCLVLKLTLQPLVENAIRYGLEENTERCLVEITAEADHGNKALFVYIKNNGSSFEENLLEKLKTHEVEPHGFGIGLLNIRDRMQLTFGEAYGLELYNEEDLAVVRLIFPLTNEIGGAATC